jgi:DNA-binding MarR family transcriptional regulator
MADWEPDVHAREIPSAEAIRAIGERFAEFDPLAVETFITLNIVASELRARGEEILQEHGLSRARFVTLILLRKAGTPLTPVELASRTNTTTASMASLLEGLTNAGLIRREPRKDDRRSHYIHLTDEGNAKLDAVLPHTYAWMRAAMQPLVAEEQRALIETLVKLRVGQEPRS